MSPGDSAGGAERSRAVAERLIKLVLVAALVTAPVFLFGEGFEVEAVWKVAASNGACVVLCLGLLRLLRAGRVSLASSILVYGLLVLVGTLASINGEPVHVNVINFTLVTVLAAALLARRHVALVAGLSGATMLGIAWARPVTTRPDGRVVDLTEARFETIAQFLPTYIVVAMVLFWMSGGRADADGE